MPRHLLLFLIVSCSRDQRVASTDSVPAIQDSLTPGQPQPPRAPADTDTTSRSQPTSVTVERAVINGVLWGASESDVETLLGKPQSTTGSVLQYPGLRIDVADSRVVGIRCTAPTCITGDAVRVGATPAEVVTVYGPGRRDSSSIRYPFTADGACALVFDLSGGRVSAINVACQPG